MAVPNYLYVAITDSQPYNVPGARPAPNGAVVSMGRLTENVNAQFAVMSFFNPAKLYQVIGVSTGLTPFELASAIANKYNGQPPLPVNGDIVTLFNFNPKKKDSLLEDLVKNAQDFKI